MAKILTWLSHYISQKWRIPVRSIFCIVMILLFIGAGTAAAEDNGAVPLTSPTVLIENYQLTPSILMPGDTGTLTITIKNTNQNANIQQNSGFYQGGVQTSENTNINVFIQNIHLEGNGLVVRTPDFQRFGSIGPGQSVPVTFLIQAPSHDGIYFPEVWIDIQDGTSTRYPIPVNVNTHIAVAKKPELLLQKTVPEGVVPGDDFGVPLILRNDGETQANDITVSINTSTPAIALKSPENFYLDHLDPGNESEFNLQFSSEKESPLGLQDILVTIRYVNPDGSQTNQIEDIGIPIKGKAEVDVKSLTTDPIRINSGDPFTMTLRIENTGTDDAKSVQATVDLPMEGNKVAFVGKIEPDNDAPALFYLQGKNSGDIPYTLELQYTDDYGTHTVMKNLTLSVGPANNTAPILIAIALVVTIRCRYLVLENKKESMTSSLQVSAILALRGLQRGNKFTLGLTILIMGLVFVMMVFQPSILTGFIKAGDNQIIDYSYANIALEPKEKQPYIEDVKNLTEKVNRIPGVIASMAEYTSAGTFTYKGTSLGSLLPQ